MKNKLLKLLIISSITVSVYGCKQEERLVLNEKYQEYYDNETQKATKGILLEYGENPSLKLDEYLTMEQELLEGTMITVHGMKDELLIEEPIKLEETLNIGDYYLVITDGNERIELLLSVRDTIVPKFVDFKDNLKFEEGKDVDLTKLFKADDLTDVEIKIEGEVDFEKAGKYKIEVIAIDKGENVTKQECTVEITEKTKEVAVDKYEDNTSNKKPSSNKTETSSSQTSSSANTDKVCDINSGGGSYGRKYPDCWYTAEGHTHITPNSKAQVIATARQHIGQTGWNCGDFVWQMYMLNKYDCYTIPYTVWYPSPENTTEKLLSVLQTGDLIHMPNHVALVASVSGNAITIIEGGVNSNNEVQENSFTVITAEDGSTIREYAKVPITQVERMGNHWYLGD